MDIEKLYENKKQKLIQSGKIDQMELDLIDFEKCDKLEECRDDLGKLFKLRESLEHED
ncbi:MAG: hypothetical protein AB1351_10500 [Thermoproteota archaeon]